MTADLLALGDWLDWHAVTHVAMESTGVLWRPVFTLLEEGRTLLLVNAPPLHAVPGRTTDVQDRRQGERVAGRPAAPRPAQGQLCPSAPGRGAARSHAV